MKRIRPISAQEANFRTEELIPGNPNMLTGRRAPVEPIPVGSYVAMIFRVTGYGPDCDGSLMAEVARVDCHGEETGWTEHSVGLWADMNIVLDEPGELHRLADGAPFAPRGRTSGVPTPRTEADPSATK